MVSLNKLYTLSVSIVLHLLNGSSKYNASGVWGAKGNNGNKNALRTMATYTFLYMTTRKELNGNHIVSLVEKEYFIIQVSFDHSYEVLA